MQMKKQASLIGLSIKDGPETSLNAVQLERAKYGTGSGVPLSTFMVTKITKRHRGVVVSRKLTITDEFLVERDAATFHERLQHAWTAKQTSARYLLPLSLIMMLQSGPSLSEST